MEVEIDTEESGSQGDVSLSEDTDSDRKLQKILYVNKFLPYYSALTAEADVLFLEIKENLSQAVQNHELWPGAVFWTSRLQR